jgi:hypothetical protein
MLPPPQVPGEMSEPFDPYRKWLGIPPKDSAGGGPNHYRLLGIATFESDPDVIENAAARQMAHVRTYKNSKHAALSQRILTELSAAKLCLLTPDHKQAYDAQLRAQLAAAGELSDSTVLGSMPATTMVAAGLPHPFLRGDDRWRTGEEAESASAGPPPVPIPMPVGTAVPTVPIIRRGGTASLRARRQRSAVPIALMILSLAILCGVAGVAALVFGGVLGRKADARPGGKSGDKYSVPALRGEKATPAAGAAKTDKSKVKGKSQATAFPIGMADGVVARQATVASPALAATGANVAMPAIDRVRQALFQAQRALESRDDAALVRQITAAEQDVTADAIDEDQRGKLREQIQHLRNLRQLVNRFWKTADDNLHNQFTVGETFKFFAHELTIVARETEVIELTFNGHTQKGPLHELDPRAAALIAARTVNVSEPATLLPIIAFLSIDRRAQRDGAGDRVVQLARKFFQENILTGELSPELVARVGMKLGEELPLTPDGQLKPQE